MYKMHPHDVCRSMYMYTVYTCMGVAYTVYMYMYTVYTCMGVAYTVYMYMYTVYTCMGVAYTYGCSMR